jgi:hypothetical protein
MRFAASLLMLVVVAACSSGAPSTSLPSAPVSPDQTSAPKTSIRSSVDSFGLLLGLPPTVVTISEANYSKAFAISGAGPATKTTCSPAKCRPSLAGADVKLNVTPVAHGSGALKIGDANGNAISIPYRVSPYATYAVPFVIIAGCLGNDGNLWTMTVDAGSSRAGNDIVVVSPKGAVLADYPLPNGYAYGGTTPGCAATAHAIWFPDSAGSVDSVSTDPATHGQFSQHALTGVSDPQAQAIATGPDGNLWIAEAAGYVARMTPKGAVTQVGIDGRPSLDAIVAGPDGNLWFSNATSDAHAMLGKITTKGVVSLYRSPTPIWLLGAGAQRMWLFSHALGGALKVCSAITGSGKIACSTTSMPNVETFGAVLGSDGAVWLSYCVKGSSCSGGLMRIEADGQRMLFDYPTSPQAVPGAIMVGPGHALWIGGIAPQPGLSKIVP